MSERNDRWARWMTVVRWVLIALALGALGNTLHHAELGRAARLVGAIGAPILLVLAPWLVTMTLQSAGYARILRALGRATSFPRLLSVMLSAEAVLMSFPAGAALAETINPYLLKRRCGVPVPEGLAAVAAKKALIVLSDALYMGVALLAGGAWLRAASRALVGAAGLEWIVAAAAVALLAGSMAMTRAIFSGSVASRSHGLLRRIPSARLRRWLDDEKGGFTETDQHFAALSAARAPVLGLATAAFLAGWLVEGAEALVILRLLRVDISYPEVLAFEVVVSLLKSLAFMVPAGLGVQDAGYVAFFAAFGIPDAGTLGVAFVLIKRAKEVFWIVVGYLLFFVLGDLPTPSPAPSLERA